MDSDLLSLKNQSDSTNCNEILLQNSESPSINTDSECSYHEEKVTSNKEEYQETKAGTLTKNLLKGALPCMIQFFSTMFVNNTTIHYIGLKDDMTLFNGMSLALNILSCFSFYLIFHSNIGFNAASSQALGAKNPRLVGLYLHRVLVIHFLVNFFAYIIVCAAPFAFRLAGLDSDVTTTAFRFLLMTPGYIIGVIIYDSFKNFLYAHKIFTPLLIIQLVITTSYWFVLDLFFVTLGMGLKGIALALTICQTIGVALLFLYLWICKPKELKQSWVRPGRHSFSGLWSLGKVMISVGSFGYVEVFAYRIQSFASAALASCEFAALTAFLAFGDLFYVLPVGISFPVVTFVGNAMGRGDKKGAIKIIKITLIISTIILAILLVIYTFIRSYLFEFYTEDPTVLKIMNKMGYLYFFTFPADFFQTILAGIIKGLAKEKVATKFFLCALYFVGLPLSMILAFAFKLCAPGMWLGNGIGIYFALAFFSWIIYKTNFKRQIDYIKKRVSIKG